ncbi:hypothetical protein EDD15DRAFT_2216488 [Pisolithus albus]|nr:hypothetical protein EDD15DRAFT_2216488 [Pisolithus albus]
MRASVKSVALLANSPPAANNPQRSPPPSPHRAASAHTPIQTHPDAPSPSPPPEQPPQGSPKNELEVADITITIADADSDSNVPASKCADNTKADSNSLPMHPRQGASADDGVGEHDGEADEQAYGDMVMDDSDTEMETDLHMNQRWTYAHIPGWKD